MSARDLFPGLGEAVAKRTFLRDMENWSDVAFRVAKGNCSLGPEDKPWLIEDLIAKGVMLTAGRHLQNGDENQLGRAGELFSNCSTAPTSTLLFLHLLSGSGVGRSYDDDLMVVDWQSLRGTPIHLYCSKDHKDGGFGELVEGCERFTIPDTREGWAKALERLETKAYAQDKDPILFDFSRIRGKGEPIHGITHGVASGPDSLRNAFSNIIDNVINGEPMPLWKQAMFVDHFVAVEVQVGGARRCLAKGTSVRLKSGVSLPIEQIVVGDELWHGRKVTAKFTQGVQNVWELETDSGLSLLATANHRIAVDDGYGNMNFKTMDQLQVGDTLFVMNTQDLIIKTKHVLDKVKSIRDTNTLVETYDLEVSPDHVFFANKILVHNSARMSTKSWRDQDIEEFIKIKTDCGLWSSNNSVMVDSEFWEKKPKILKEAITSLFKNGEPGFINGDMLHDTKYKTYKWKKDYSVGSERFQPSQLHEDLIWDIGFRAEHTRFPTTTNPCVVGETQILTDDGYQEVQKISFPSPPVHFWVDNELHRGTSFHITGIKDVYTLELEGGQSIRLTKDHKVFVKRQDGEAKVEAGLLVPEDEVVLYDGTTSRFKSLKYYGSRRVYDASVPGKNAYIANGIKVSNCGEIPLHVMGGLCVIGDVAPVFGTDYENLEAVKAMARFLIRVNMMDTVYKKEVERTNRIGVSLTGIHEYAWRRFGYDFYDLIDENKSKPFWDTLRAWSKAAYREADRYSEMVGMRIPATVTTIKPAGSTSKLFGLSEGAHLPAKLFYIRWVQFREDSPEIEMYEKHGYPVRSLKTFPGVKIVGFPTSPYITQIMPLDRIVTATEATPEQQYQWIRLLEKHWLGERGGQVSYTLKIDTGKVGIEEFTKTVIRNQPTVRCCSILPFSAEHETGYEYLPEEIVDRETYQILVTRIEKCGEDIDLEHLKCENGACPI